MTQSQTAEEVFETLTGFDEIAIAFHFGKTVSDLAQSDPSMFGRALVFILKRREGATDDEARNAALGMTMKEFQATFAEPSKDDEVGKAEAEAGEPVEAQPESSLSSVS